MNMLTRAASDAATRFSVHVVTATVLAVLAAWLTIQWLIGAEPPRLVIVAAVSAIYLSTALLALGVYLLNRDNYRLRQCAYDLHDINHIYRDALSRLFSNRTQPDPEQFLLVEREVLNSVCVKIANIFVNLIGRKCVVTVKLLTKEDNRTFCFTWARSDRELLRDTSSVDWYEVGTGANTGFDEALKLRPASPSYFYSPDLIAMGPAYSNRREAWQRFYQSTIVVPIHHVVVSEKRTEALGFLCVDTMSQHRLNETYHVQFLAAFADQMYNFLSLMRRRYLLPTVSASSATPAEPSSSHVLGN